MARSCWSSRLAIVQPPFSSPIRCRAGTRTSSKKVWQKGDAPLINGIGVTLTPVLSMSIRMKEMPSCLGTSVFVRTRQKIQSDTSASEVQIFWPLMT